jgi:two-component system, cell cycle sensor histidine kinase and response regulator CckA
VPDLSSPPLASLWRSKREWLLRPRLWGGAFIACLVIALIAFLASVPPVVIALAAAMALAAAFGLAWTQGRRSGIDPVARLLVAAADGNPEARLLTTAEGAFVYANPSFLQLFFMPTSLAAIESILADGEQAADEFRRLRAAAAAGVGGSAELPFSISKGNIEWRRITVQPLAGPPAHALWRAEDITARREMESIRRREEEMLADFLDNLPAGFFSADGDGRIVHANATLADWLGISVDRLRTEGLAFSDFVIASGDTWASSDGDAPAHGEVTLESADGETFLATLLQSERDDRAGNMLYSRSIVLRDVVWRENGDPVASALSRLHWLFDEAPVGIAILDLQGDVSDCNRAFLKLLGLHREAVAGRPLADRMVKEDRSDFATQLSKVVMGTSKASHIEVRMPAAGERELSLSVFASRLEDTVGEVSGLVLHFIDTTEQKSLEIQFTQAQKVHAVGQLAGGIAHDFNNMLTAIIGFSDLLLARHGPEDPSFADIMQIKQNSNRATNLVRQLLAFSRKQQLKPVNLDIRHALSDLSHMLRRLMGETIELRIEHGDDSGLVRVDPVQFDQVVINLAVNARDAMTGGGTLDIRTSRVRIDEAVSRGAELMPQGTYVLIVVTDTGMGISKENIAQIFEPFFSTKEKGSGTGLGLSTVYGIVRQTGGFIFVDSAPGDGTVFNIYLPEIEAAVAAADAAAALAQAAAPEPEKDLTGGGTVLLVEDEDAVRLFGARALRNKGYTVLEADSGESALDVINDGGDAIDLIISDVVMPGMDGHTFVKLVRQEMPNVKVILVSGYAEDALADDIERDPTIHFLPKPYSLQELAGKAKEVMLG